MAVRSVALLAVLAAAAAADVPPLPFTRGLLVTDPMMSGDDVLVLQGLLVRSPAVPPYLAPTGQYDPPTAAAVGRFQRASGLLGPGLPTVLGQVDNATARAVLGRLSDDGYADEPGPLPPGVLYKVHVPVHRNRSIETTATLYSANGTALETMVVRTHGQNHPGTDVQLNQFTAAGVTPTGLAEFDLQSPEDDPKSFGPYPVNRFVRGLRGNMAIAGVGGAPTFVSDIRDGLLLHTGEWAGWNTSMPMPNSHGCVHSWPQSIKRVWEILTGDLGVEVRQNTNGRLPYPYRPQGLVSVELVG